MPDYPFLRRTNYLECEVAVNQVNSILDDGGRTLDIFQQEGHFRIIAERCEMRGGSLVVESSKPFLKRNGTKWREAPPDVKYGRLGSDMKTKFVFTLDQKPMFTVIASPWKGGLVRYVLYHPGYDPNVKGSMIVGWENETSPILG